MLRNEQRRSTDRVPGKVFLLGEYAVLSGAPALLLPTFPEFSMRDGELAHLPAKSPAGKLLEHARALGHEITSFEVSDPYAVSGGLGASTAQFALLYRRIFGGNDWKKAWELYRELEQPSAGVAPSGADLLAQMSFAELSSKDQGGACRVEAGDARWVGAGFDWGCVQIFSTTAVEGRKVPTFSHLAEVSPAQIAPVVEPARAMVARAETALAKNDPAALGAVLNDYAELLSGSGFELLRTRDERKFLVSLPGVLGAKGAGALGADALVVIARDSSTREKVRAVGREMGLVAIEGPSR